MRHLRIILITLAGGILGACGALILVIVRAGARGLLAGYGLEWVADAVLGILALWFLDRRSRDHPPGGR